MTLLTTGGSTVPAAEVIKDALRTKLGRQWRVGDRLPPLKDLARQLGTGQTNTHQAVRDLVAEGLLDSRQRRGTYVVRLPQSTRVERRKPANLAGATVGLYYSNPTEGLIRRMMDGFCEVMAPTGATITQVILSPGGGCVDPPVAHDAVAFFNPGSTSSHAPDTCSPNQLVSIVSTSGRILLDRDERYDFVTVDELHGGELAGRLLRAAGCRQCCFLGRGKPPTFERCDQTSALRLYGFEGGWGDSIEPQHILLRYGYSPQAGGQIFQRHYLGLPGDRPDGIFAASDELAVGFIGAAAAHGLLPGRDYQIVGFDGQDLGGASLTTVQVPSVEMGRRAARLLIERFADPDRPVHRLQLECKLHRGTTTSTTASISSLTQEPSS